MKVKISSREELNLKKTTENNKPKIKNLVPNK
jgi:hypothetical protein